MNTGTALTPTPRSPTTWGERLQRLHIDLWLLTLLLAIASIGLITLYSASGHSLSAIFAQAQRLLLGLAVMAALAQVPPDYYRAAAPWFYGVAVLLLMLVLLLGRYLVTSKFGRILTAIRDAESRVMFLGYNPLHYKLAIWTLSAMLCAVAGALYVPQVGIINPGEMSAANSIEIAIWVAVGGRATLVGPVIGAGVVNLSKSFFTQAFPEYWLFFLGALFVAVTLWLPDGIVGLWKKWRGSRT